MALHLVALCIIILVALTPSRAEAQVATVDLELVLAVDVSGSIDPGESALQRQGYLAAIRSPEFVAAVRAGSLEKIRLTYVEWAGENLQQVTVPWRVIDGPEAAQAFASELAEQPAAPFRRGTSISSALVFSAGLFEGGSIRRVIDISGDGPNNAGGMVTVARDAVVAQGIVINGLPMLISPAQVLPPLDRYFVDCVIGGEGSFSLPVTSVGSLAEAIRMKLLRELLSANGSGNANGNVIPVAAEPATDCLAGEKERALRMDQY
ncbi:MAG: DUF1194 domain-containing protein [Aestuariivirga sp.]|nr:DUF1194 domain-containing protein [Aestuariivirga sp.]